MSGKRFTVAPGTRLLHIGPHKTGTTALQGAFHIARGELAKHGVVYAGEGRQAKEPAVAITSADALSETGAGAGAGDGDGDAKLERWAAFCAEVAEAGDRRVMISSEFFSQADAGAAQATVKGLSGGDADVHVVVTLRPLRKILPSHWQQYVKHGLCHSYEDWLDGMLRKPPYDSPTPDFWHRQRHDALLARWADAVGPGNLTVVVVNDAEPLWLFRVFEGLLDLPDGLLVPEKERVNPSLTQSQTELLVRLNRRLQERDMPRGKLVREGVVPQLQTYEPSSDEPRITTPDWADAAAAEVAEEMVGNISGLGVRIIGDLSALTWKPGGSAAEAADAPQIPTAAAVEAVLGGIQAGSALATSRQERRARSGELEDRTVRKVTARDLLRVVARRGLRRLRR